MFGGIIHYLYICTMRLEDLFYELLTVSFPRGELRDRMFAYHNDMVGKSQYFVKWENPRTMCGSCVMRVKASIFKYYHFEYPSKNPDMIFLGKFGVNNIPIYGVDKKRKG